MGRDLWVLAAVALTGTTGCKQILGIEDLAVADAGSPDAGVDNGSHDIPLSCPIAFTLTSSGQSDVLMASFDGKEITSFAAGPGVQRDLAWSPDGQQVAYSTGMNGREVIEVYTPSTGQTTTISANQENRGPAWAPDGTHIAFYTFESMTEVNQIFVVDPDGNNAHPITTEPSGADTPVWSPDGRWIAYRALPESGSGDYPSAMIVGADGGEPVDLGPISSFAPTPPVSWSPDGTQVALLRDDGAIVVKSFDGTNERVISTESIATPPAWSPDGGRIVYAWGSSLVLVRPDGSGPQEVLLEGYNEHPVWSPDSLAIAFISNSYQDSSRQIQVIDVFGRGLTTIYSPTISDSFIEQPVWASNCDTGIKNPAVLAEAGLAAVLAADQETLFWADPGTNKIFRVTKSGGVVQPVADTDPSPDALIVGADSFVYWKTSGGLLSRAISSQNSQAQSLAYGVNSAQLAADDDYIYFGLDDPLEPANNGIVRWGFATQKLEHLADAGVIGGIAVDDAYVYWSTFGDHYEGTGTIRRVPKAGGTPEVIASQQSRPIFLTAAGGQIYWTSSATGVDGPRTGESTVMRADADGQNAVAVMSDQSACRRVTVTDSRIWAVCDDTLYYVPVETDGSIAPTPQSTLQGRYISSIAVDDQWIFAAADAQIVQTPK